MKILDKKIILTTQEIAAELSVERNYISTLVNDHGMPKIKHNQFDLVKVLRWHRKYKVDEKEREIEKLKQDDPVKDLARKNARLKEIAILEKEEALVDLEAVRIAWMNMTKVIVDTMDGFAAKTAPVVKGVESVNEIKTLLQNEMNKIKERINSTNINAIVRD